MGSKGSQKSAGGRGRRTRHEVEAALVPADERVLVETPATPPSEVVRIARQYAPEAIRVLRAIYRSKQQPTASRVAAARAVVGYANGEAGAGAGSGAKIQINIVRMTESAKIVELERGADALDVEMGESDGQPGTAEQPA